MFITWSTHWCFLQSPLATVKKKWNWKGKRKRACSYPNVFGYTFNFWLTFFFLKKTKCKIFFMACPWEERLIRWPPLFLSQHSSLSMQVAATSESRPAASSSRHCNKSPTPARMFFRRRSVLIHHNHSRPQHCRQRSSSPRSHWRWRKTEDSPWSRSWTATWLTCTPPSSKVGHASLSSSSSA